MDGRLEKINQRGITWKIRKGEQSFLCATHHCNLIHIPIKCMKIPQRLLSYGAYKNVWKKINQRGITWKLRKGEQSFLCETHRLDLIYTPINLYEDILKGY